MLKSFGKAYQETVRNKQANNPFADKFQQVFVNSRMNTPMTKEEACQILNYEEKEVVPDLVMKRYFTLMERNREGGSLYLQAKVMSAKNLMMEGHQDIARKMEEEWQARQEEDKGQDKGQDKDKAS